MRAARDSREQSCMDCATRACAISCGTCQASNATGSRKPELGGRVATPGVQRQRSDGYHRILEFCENRHAQSVGIFARLTPEDLNGTCVPPEPSTDHCLELARFDGGA